ncbi:MAG: hypothetical protein K2H89_07735 [Oscillospiraceae bacterium]|nr:hypothetical protein [Oscillospiraceae bacterium]
MIIKYILDFLGNLNLETDISISTLDISTNIYLDLLASEEVYYREIFHYCYNRLYGDFHADCTQEVMLVLCKKVNTLDMSKEIRPWLYSVAPMKKSNN